MERGSLKFPRCGFYCFLAIAISGFASLRFGADVAPNPHLWDHQLALAERWPGGWIVDFAWGWYGACVLCLLGLVAGTDILRRRPEWMRPAAGGIVAAGAVIAVAGLIAGGPVAWMFRDAVDLPGHPFAGFFHYSFAGAYLNLVWPLAFALAVTPGRGGGSVALAWFGRGLAGGCGGVVFAAVWTLPTDAARALSLAILGVLLLAWAEAKQGGFRSFWGRFCEHYGRAKAFGALIATGVLLFALLGFTVGRTAFQGWGAVSASGPVAELAEPLPNRGDLLVPSEDPRAKLPQFERRLAWATARSMVADAGLFGFGPRAWKNHYAFYTDDFFLLSFYLHIQFVHNDFLQYLVEWGWLGGVGWIMLWLLILWSGGCSFWRRLDGKGSWTRPDWLAFAAWLGVGSCLVHAQVDFPLQSAGLLATAAVCSALVLADPSRVPRRRPPAGG